MHRPFPYGHSKKSSTLRPQNGNEMFTKATKRSDYTEQKLNKFSLNCYYAFIVCFAHFRHYRCSRHA